MDFSYLDMWEEEPEEEDVEELGGGYRNIWVVAETSRGTLSPASLEVLAQARSLADQIGVYVYGVLLGESLAPLADELIAYGADRVLVAIASNQSALLNEYQPEIYVQALESLVTQHRPEILLLPATSLGNDLAPRLAQRLKTGLISHCIQLQVDMAERLLVGTSQALAGELYHSFTCPEARPQMATVEPGYFSQPYKDEARSGNVQTVDIDLSTVSGRLDWSQVDLPYEPSQQTLQTARRVISAGRGMGDAAGFALVEELAAALGGVVAGSRGAFDQGWIVEDQVVGIGGESVAPDIYLACGISGDIHHYVGAQQAKFIVAINPDENAPIMKVANFAVAADAREVLPAMLKALSELNQEK